MLTSQHTSPLTQLNAQAARALFKAGKLEPSELLEATLDRIDEVNGDRERGINAFTEVLAEEARAAARAADAAWAAARRSGIEPPALLGIPVATKEKHGLAGRSLEQGLASQRGVLAAAHHPVVERILAAGGIIHARTTSPEFSCATVTHSPAWGVTRNPWNLEASPGGSSGGAGAALAAGMATLATASDIAGSTRIPAGFTGTVGYKAPYGRIPGLPPLSADWYRGDGPMARTVADTALLAEVMSGVHPLDHGSVGVVGAGELLRPLDRIAEAQLSGSLKGRRVGLSMILGDYPIASSVRENTERVAALLEAAGATIVPVTLPWTTERITATTFAHFGHILGPAMAQLTAGTESEPAAYTRQFIADAARAAAGVSLPESMALDAQLQQELAVAMDGLDALLAPTQGIEMLDAAGDYLSGVRVLDADGELVQLGHYWEAHLTSPFNVANRCPVLAVPSGISSVGVPTSVQVVGHPWDEGMVFEIGAVIEQVVKMPEFPGL
ncbi:amidase [Leucobacter salsicius]|uniref:amidase n=1 Tax=Leucobacter salsicius TaxID=664638 RepID=UPI0003448BB3|nr:amidase [Leucobacter salsicius]